MTGSTVALVGAGTCTIAADQSGSTAYAAAAQVQQSFTVGLAAQAIAFTSVPPVAAAAGGAGYTVAAVATSGLAVAFSLDPASTGICSITGAAVSLLADGTCTIFADQAGDSGTRPPSGSRRASRSARVPQARAPQTISFTTTVPTAAATGGSYTPAASASSGLPDHVRGRAGECRGVCPLRWNGVLRRDGHVHRARRPGGQREL